MRVIEDFELHGMLIGNVVVASGGILILRGLVIGAVILEPESAVEIFGIVTRDVTNQGGRLRVHGTIAGKIHSMRGTTIIERDAKVDADWSR